MFLIQVREIIWNDVIQKVKEVWDHMIFMDEEKLMVRDLESIILTNKDNLFSKCQFFYGVDKNGYYLQNIHCLRNKKSGA